MPTDVLFNWLSHTILFHRSMKLRSSACVITFSVSLILQGGGLHKGELDRREVLAQAQPQEHLDDELACAVCQDIVPAPLYSQAQVLQLAYARLGHATCLIL